MMKKLFIQFLAGLAFVFSSAVAQTQYAILSNFEKVKIAVTTIQKLLRQQAPIQPLCW